MKEANCENRLVALILKIEYSKKIEKPKSRSLMKKFSMFFLFISFAALAGDKIILNVELSPAGSFQAISENMKGELVKKEGVLLSEKISIEIESLKTGIDLRDEHLWKHMNSKKYQKAILTNLKGRDGVAQAHLEVAGKKRPVQIQYHEEGSSIIGKFKVLAHDFNLPEAEYLGIGVSDEVIGEVKMAYKKL